MSDDVRMAHEREALPENESGGPFLIDSIEKPILIFILVFLLGFILVRIASATWSSNGVQRKSEICNINKDLKENSMNVDLVLSSISSIHKNIVLKCAAILNDAANSVKDIDYSFLVHYLKNGEVIDSKAIKNEKSSISFSSGSDVSQEIELFLHSNEVNFDEIDLQLSINSNLELLKAFRFTWELENVNAEKYVVISRLILTGMISYVLGIYVIHSGFGIISASQLVCTFLGVFGCLASLPLKKFMDRERYLFINSILTAFVVYTYRLSCNLQIRAVDNRTGTIPIVEIILNIVFYLVYIILNGVAFSTIDNIVLTSNFLLYSAIFEAIFAGITMARQIFFGKIFSAKRFVFFISMSAINIIFNLTIQNKFVVDPRTLFYAIESGLWSSLHTVMVVFVLFLMQFNIDEGYNQINDLKITMPEFFEADHEADLNDFENADDYEEA